MNIINKIFQPFRWKSDRQINNQTLNTINNALIKYLHWNLIELTYATLLLFIISQIPSAFYNANIATFYGNILYWHSSNVHHFLDLIGITTTMLVLIYLIGYSPLKAIIVTYFIIALNEVLWSWTFALSRLTFAYYTNTTGLINGLISGQNQAYAIFIIAFIIIAIKTKKLKIPKYTIIFILTIMSYWFTQGFHITIDYNGATQFYYDIQTNLLEIGHWLLSCIALITELYFIDSFKIGNTKPITKESPEKIYSKSVNNMKFKTYIYTVIFIALILLATSLYLSGYLNRIENTLPPIITSAYISHDNSRCQITIKDQLSNPITISQMSIVTQNHFSTFPLHITFSQTVTILCSLNFNATIDEPYTITILQSNGSYALYSGRFV